MPYDYTLTTVIPASARDIYDAWLDSLAHSEMTGGPANMSSELGAEFSAWDGYITGRNLELVPGERIVQSWRTTKFPEEHKDSILTVTLEERDDGTLLTLSHSNVPEGHVGYEQGGWQQYYFDPMIAYFSGEPGVGGEAAVEQPGPVVKPEVSPAERTSQRVAQQPVRRARPKRPLARKKAVAAKARPKRPAASKKTTAPKAAPKRGAARSNSATRRTAALAKAPRKGAATSAKSKSKKAVTKKRTKPAIRAKTRTKRGSGARR